VTLDVREVDTERGRVEAAFVGGSGPAVLVLHGMPGSFRQALPLARDLADRYRVILPSRPGYGRTPLATGRTPDEQAAAYAALLDALGIDTVAVIGISGGGPSAAAFAASFPARCSALTMVCALVPHLFDVDPKIKRALAVPLLWETVGTIDRWRTKRKLGRATPEQLDAQLTKELNPTELATLPTDPQMRDRLVEFARSHADAPAPWAGFRNDAKNIINAQGGAPRDYTTVRAPVLVLSGDRDTVVSAKHAEFWATTLPRARAEIIEGGGHAFLITRRLQTMPTLVAHLQDSLGHDGAVDIRR
jgi:pimeloyl-ACP methyl ester carboxylesterase